MKYLLKPRFICIIGIPLIYISIIQYHYGVSGVRNIKAGNSILSQNTNIFLDQTVKQNASTDFDDVEGSSDHIHILEPSSSEMTLPENEEMNIQTQFNYTEHTRNIVSARLGIMEVSPGIIQEMSKVNISIIISHCNENVDWIPQYIGHQYSIKDITIYSKCGKEVEGLHSLEVLTKSTSAINVVTLPNVGRCDHTYAYWIQEQYQFIDKDRDGNDIVMFLKANPRNQGMYLPIDLLFSHVAKAGFACVTKPLCNCNPKCDSYKKDGLLVPMMQHKRKFLLENFHINHYSREDNKNDSTGSDFLSGQYTNLKIWKENMGFVIPESGTMPVCYGGLFVAQKKQFLNHAKKSWEKMVASLSRADNIVEGHYAERMWASILSDIGNRNAKAVDKVLTPHIAEMMIKKKEWCAMKGMVYVRSDAQMTLP